MTPTPLSAHIVREAVARAIAEDLGGRGDVTSEACIPAEAKARFEITARQPGIVCGLQPAQEAFVQVSAGVRFLLRAEDGDTVEPGDVLGVVEGPARALLTAERTALNFLGRMSGIATLTARYVDAVKGSDAQIVHTRKTTPGLRVFELQAVEAGGGARHRFGLDDAVLIKDNHVAVAGGVGEAVKAAKAHVGHMTRVAVEVDRLDQLGEALEAGAEGVLLDNFSLEDLSAAVKQAKGKATLEASGGVNLDTVADIAATGVDVISVGALTHSAPNFDVGLDEPEIAQVGFGLKR
jgi:nicotinate-nucleotide pyrophosphorylase (carboxylating)